jgi:hypothetical protein
MPLFSEKPTVKVERAVPFAKLGLMLDASLKAKLKQRMSPNEFKTFSESTLEDSVACLEFAEGHLKSLAVALDAQDESRILEELDILAAGLNTLVPVFPKMKTSPASGASNEGDRYKIYLGSGTRGHRIFISRENETGKFDWLRFPTDGEQMSLVLQQGFRNLFGDRAIDLSPNPKTPELYVPIRDELVGICPCGSGKEFKQCHGK